MMNSETMFYTIELNNYEEEFNAFDHLLTEQLDICSLVGSANTEKFSTVIAHCIQGGVQVEFELEEGVEETEAEGAIEGFLNEFQTDLKNEEYSEEFLEVLSEYDLNTIPNIISFERAYV